MDIKQLKQFLAAADSGSFTRGAAQAHVSQPALSAAIAKLEAELGCQLFIRNKRNVVLTAEGQRLKHSARMICDEAESVRRTFRQRKQTTILRIYAAPDFPADFLSLVLRSFARTAPHIVFDVTKEDQLKRRGGKDRKSFDMRFDILADSDGTDGAGYGNGGTKEGKASRSDNVVVLRREAFGVAVPQDHAFASRKSVSGADIAREPFIARMQCGMRKVMEDWLEDQGIELSIQYRTDSDARAIALVEAGLGLTMAPVTLQGQGIRFLPLRDARFWRKLVVSVPTDRRESVAQDIADLLNGLSDSLPQN